MTLFDRYLGGRVPDPYLHGSSFFMPAPVEEAIEGDDALVITQEHFLDLLDDLTDGIDPSL